MFNFVSTNRGFRSTRRVTSGQCLRALVPNRRRGFTLLEILVVLLILGLLAGLAITNVDKIFGGAQVDTTRLFVNQSMKLPLNAYRASMGEFPSTSEGLQALVAAPANRADRWRGPYIEGGVPLDPWKEPYQYVYPGQRNKGGYDLWSKGPDKQTGTEDDIGNWESGTPDAK
jgi:general secretion pathway protein G